MGVDQPAAEAFQEGRSDQFHESRQHHQIGLVGRHLIAQPDIPQIAISALAQPMHEGRQPGPLRPVQPGDLAPIGTDGDDLGGKTGVCLRIDQRLQQGARSGHQDDYAECHIGTLSSAQGSGGTAVLDPDGRLGIVRP